MDRNGKPFEGLSVPLEATHSRLSLLRSEITAPFISQLLAERDQFSASGEGAAGAYAKGAVITVKRMPLGYRTSLVV